MSPVDSCWDETCIPVQVSFQFPAMPYYLGLTEVCVCVCVWCAEGCGGRGRCRGVCVVYVVNGVCVWCAMCVRDVYVRV